MPSARLTPGYLWGNHDFAQDWRALHDFSLVGKTQNVCHGIPAKKSMIQVAHSAGADKNHRQLALLNTHGAQHTVAECGHGRPKDLKSPLRV
jgi:hypothetical protein